LIDYADVAKPIGTVKKREAGTLGEALGAELTRLRVVKNWTQQRVSEMLGYDVTYIRQLERGGKSPTLRTLSHIAEIYSLRVSVLIARAERILARERAVQKK
jgi:transcriptional regulator with XRE-family HTH domain